MAGPAHVDQRLTWDFEEGSPKTDASDATIALDSGTVAVLKAHKAWQHKERLA